jgi:hypothetical protein
MVDGGDAQAEGQHAAGGLSLPGPPVSPPSGEGVIVPELKICRKAMRRSYPLVLSCLTGPPGRALTFVKAPPKQAPEIVCRSDALGRRLTGSFSC